MGSVELKKKYSDDTQLKKLLKPENLLESKH